MFDRSKARLAVVGCGLVFMASGVFAADGGTSAEVGGTVAGTAAIAALPFSRTNQIDSSTLQDDATYTAHWVIDNADNHGRPFAIVDKRTARLLVFAPDGSLVASTSVLIGLAPGDDAIPDIAHRAPMSLSPAERTTPSGRFASQPGHNDKGEDIVWIDYDASLAIHRLRPAPAIEHRIERLASSRVEDKRISFGCVVVPVAFYDRYVAGTLGRSRGVVYVLPEKRSVQEMLGEFELGRSEPAHDMTAPPKQAARETLPRAL